MQLLSGDIITEYDDMIPSDWLMASLRSLAANEVLLSTFHVSQSDIQLNIVWTILRCITAKSCMRASRMLARIDFCWLRTR